MTTFEEILSLFRYCQEHSLEILEIQAPRYLLDKEISWSSGDPRRTEKKKLMGYPLRDSKHILVVCS